MKRICFCLALLAIVLSSPVPALANHPENVSAPTAIDATKNYPAIGEHAFFLLEPDVPLGIEQARARYAIGAFRPAGSPVPGFGLVDRGVWLKFDVRNPSRQELHRRITLQAPWLDHVDVYIINNGEIVYRRQTGDALPLASRQPDNRLYVFEHAFAPGTSMVYLRAQSHEPLVLPVSFSDLKEAARHDRNRSYGYGILFGIISGLLLFNLLIYISIRQQRYLFYVLYLCMYLFMAVAYTGHGYFYLWPDASRWQHWANSTSLFAYSTAGILFALSFLKMKELFPVIYKNTIRFCLFICSLQVLFIALGLEKSSVAVALMYVMFFSVFTFYFAIISFNKGHNDAVYYLVATFATLIGAAVTVLSVISVVPFTPLTFHAGEIAVSFDSILLSIALAEQIRRAQNEKLQAQKLARTDILTRLNNRLAFDEISEQIWNNANHNGHELCFIMLDIDRFKDINDTHGHAAGDSVLKTISSVLQNIVREGDVLVRWGGEEFAIILPQTSPAHAGKLAERIRGEIENLEITASGVPIRITVSLGVAHKTRDTRSIDDLFAVADENLYRAKQHGRNRVYSAAT